MVIETPKLLPEHLEMLCYACEEVAATHLCRYHVGDLVVQVCLCELCMKIDTHRLLENTIGIQSLSDHAMVEPDPDDHQREERSTFTHSWSIHL